MNINKTLENEKLTMELDGRLDTSTSPLLQEELVPAFETAKEVVLDFTKLVYISSAGLRVLLVGQKTANKKERAMVITGVSAEIMEIFEMTGFDSLLTIQ